MRKVYSLVYLFDSGGRLLLGMKKRGFGAGRWNGFGGKPHGGETLEEAARRELKEESGIDADALEKVAYLEFEFEKERGTILEGHIFRSHAFRGEPQESEEMRPAWFAQDALPFDEMWPDDRHWFPLLLSGKKFRGKFLFGDGDRVLRKDVLEVTAL